MLDDLKSVWVRKALKKFRPACELCVGVFGGSSLMNNNRHKPMISLVVDKGHSVVRVGFADALNKRLVVGIAEWSER